MLVLSRRSCRGNAAAWMPLRDRLMQPVQTVSGDQAYFATIN